MKVLIALLLSGTFAMALDISGTVVLPDGSPAESAQVALVNSHSILNMYRAGVRPSGNADLTLTGADGRFHIDTTNEAVSLIALNRSGFIEVPFADLKNNSKIVLKPWGGVEGVFRVGTSVATNQQMILQSDFTSSRIFLELDAFQQMTDQAGRFAFTYVPTGTWRVTRGSEWFGDTVTVKAGETNHITVGGTGRPLVAKFLIPENVAKLRQGPIPPSGWILNFFEPDSSERPAYMIMAHLYGSDHRERHANLTTGGIIRFEDVTPGKWWMVADLSRVPKEGGEDTAYATFGREVVVPEIPGGRSDVPLDLGDLKPVIVHTPQVGEDAPPLAVETVDGSTFNLAEHRGQYVLLDFEALFRTEETNASVESVWKAYGGDKRFAVLTLQVPPTGGTYLYFNEQNWNSGWPLARLEKVPWYELRSMRAGFGLQCDFVRNDHSLPAIFLIGPDGKFVGSRLKGDEIAAVVGRFLGKK